MSAHANDNERVVSIVLQYQELEEDLADLDTSLDELALKD